MQPGKTLWEKLQDRLKSATDTGVAFYNPLDAGVGSLIPLTTAELMGYNFTVREIRELTRHIRGKDFIFTDYVLEGFNPETPEKKLEFRLRANPTDSGLHTLFLLTKYDSLAYDEGLEGVVRKPDVQEDGSSFFETTDDDGTTQSYARLNNLAGEPYSAVVGVIGETNLKHLAITDKIKPLKLDYWDYWRDVEIAKDKTHPELCFVEMNTETGWFEIWKGIEIFL